MLTAVVARLDDEDPNVRKAAVEAVVHKHTIISHSLCEVSRIASLYKTVLERGFREQFSWYIKQDKFCINMPDGIATNLPTKPSRQYYHLRSERGGDCLPGVGSES